MMLPEEFNEKWDVNKDGPLIKFHYEDLLNIDFSNEVKRFLSIGGIPETPSPYLDFTSLDKLLKPITTVFNMPEKFQEFWFLGSTGAGDPICIVEKKESIVFLDNSRDYNEVFINSSLNQFAECLLVYSKMIDKAIEMNGEDAFIDNDIPESVIVWMKEEFERIDLMCIDEESFWFIEIEKLQE